MNSIFRYPGGKSRKGILNKIKNKMPDSYDEFREPFVGGGGLFFSLPAKGKRWINDMHPGLISVYKALRYKSKDFIAKCEEIAPEQIGEPLVASQEGGKELYNSRLKKVFDKFKLDEEMDQALRYFFLNRTVWMGRVNYKILSRLYFSNPSGWNIVKTNKLKKAAKHLKGVNITRYCGTALLKCPGKNVFIYVDAPYLSDTKQPKSSQLYEYTFQIKDHVKLSEEIKKCKHKILISYDDDEDGFIRGLYEGFNIFEEKWTYSGSSSADGQEKTKRKGRELLITNYTVKEVESDLFGNYVK